MPRYGGYKLTDGDRQIFAAAKENPNIFTDFYLRSPTSGTWFRPVPEYLKSDVPEIKEAIVRWRQRYGVLHSRWLDLGKPEKFEHRKRTYRVIYEELEEPSFFDHHGVLFLPWQLELYKARQTTRIVIGGYGSSKTWGELLANLVLAATLREYRAFVIAPYSIQAMEVFQQAQSIIRDTEYEKRFIKSMKASPPAAIVVSNDLVGESRIEFYSIQDGSDKILNLSGDAAHIEQAEQIDDLDTLMRNLGSRFRGVTTSGRERLGKITLIANSGENQRLWEMFDEGQEMPDIVYTCQPTTFDNPFITVRQLIDIERRMGSDPQRRAEGLYAVRPLMSGEHFSAETIRRCRENNLDQLMQEGLERGDPGYHMVFRKGPQVVEWELPPLKDHIYMLASDPGWNNPPERNSPAIMVFDVTTFPQTPAFLTAFRWVYGNSSPEPWISSYIEMTRRYNCINRNIFDATGPQAGYERWVHGLQELNPEPLKLTQATKFTALNTAKTLAARGLIQFPNIQGLIKQLGYYRLPDDKMAQDLVMTFIIAAWWMERLYYENEGDPEIFPEGKDRYSWRKGERYRLRR